MQKTQLSENFQRGSVLFMALVFLVLTALIAVTIMDTSIISRKMAGNSQFREEAMQVTEGVVNETVYNVIDLLGAVQAPVVGDILCMTASTEADCTKKVLTISQDMKDAAGPATLYYKAKFYNEKVEGTGVSRLDETQSSESLLLRFVDVQGSYNGVDSGLSQASLAIGIVNKALSPSSGGSTATEIGSFSANF